MNILGLDNGYKFTKTSKGVSICSTIKKAIDDINDVIQVNIDGVDYIVGEPKGDYISDADKLKTNENKENLKVCTLTAIGLSYPGDNFIETNLVVGLPIAYFSKQKESFKNMMENLSSKIVINKIGKEQTIKIKDVLVYPQSAGLIFKKADKIGNETSLVIDIGGNTWDISQFNGLKLEEKATYQDGMMILDSKIAQYLNSTYYTKFDASDIYDLIQRNYFTVEGEKKSMNETTSIIKDHVAGVVAKIKRDFDITNVDNIFVIGGGAEPIKPYLKEYIPNIEVEKNAQFANADCFEYMGEIKFEK